VDGGPDQPGIRSIDGELPQIDGAADETGDGRIEKPLQRAIWTSGRVVTAHQRHDITQSNRDESL